MTEWCPQWPVLTTPDQLLWLIPVATFMESIHLLFSSSLAALFFPALWSFPKNSAFRGENSCLLFRKSTFPFIQQWIGSTHFLFLSVLGGISLFFLWLRLSVCVRKREDVHYLDTSTHSQPRTECWDTGTPRLVSGLIQKLESHCTSPCQTLQKRSWDHEVLSCKVARFQVSKFFPRRVLNLRFSKFSFQILSGMRCVKMS